MTFLYVLLGIILFFAFLLNIKGKVILEVDPESELYLAVKVLCFTFRISPGKEPKPINIKDFTPEKHRKRLRKNYQSYLKKQEQKAQKAAEKAAKKEKKKAEKNAPKPPKRSILDWLDIATSVLKVLFERFAKHLHIKVARLRINVATGDAASTAIMYGIVIQSVAYIIEILNSITNLDGLKRADIAVNADYLSESTTFDLKFVFSLRVRHVFSIVFGVIGRAIKKFFETSPDKQAPQNAVQPTNNGHKTSQRRPERTTTQTQKSK